MVDPQNFEVARQSLKDPFHLELVLLYKLNERGGGTLISYTETSCPSGIQGSQRETLEQATNGFMNVLDFIRTDIAHSNAAESSAEKPLAKSHTEACFGGEGEQALADLMAVPVAMVPVVAA